MYSPLPPALPPVYACPIVERRRLSELDFLLPRRVPALFWRAMRVVREEAERSIPRGESLVRMATHLVDISEAAQPSPSARLLAAGRAPATDQEKEDHHLVDHQPSSRLQLGDEEPPVVRRRHPVLTLSGSSG